MLLKFVHKYLFLLERINERKISLQQYVEAGTYIVLEIQLDKALVPKRMPEELARRCVAMVLIFIYIYFLQKHFRYK